MAPIDRRTGLASLAALPLAAFGGRDADARSMPARDAAAIAIVSLSEGREDETARLRDAFARLRDGGTLEIRGQWLIASPITVAGLSHITIAGIGARISLASTVWGGHAAVTLRDCSRATVQGIDFNCSGSRFLAEKHPPVAALAIISTAANGNVAEKRSHDISVDCSFEDCATRGLAVRLVDGITIRGRFRRKAWNSHFVEIARSDRVDVSVDCDAGPQERMSEYGANVVVSPGASMIADADAEWATFPALHFVAGAPSQGVIDWQAPATGSRGSFSYASVPEIAPGGDYSTASWFFACYDTNGAENVTGEQIRVVSVDQAAKRVTVELRQAGGEARSFAGQRFRISGITVDRFCRDVRIHDCTLTRASGCGVFLLACDGFQIVNNTAVDNLDYGLDVEWCVNGLIADNVVAIRDPRPNYGIGALFLVRNVRVSGNIVTSTGAKVGIVHFGNGQVSAGLTIADNQLQSARIECHGVAGAPCIVDGLVVERNLLRGTAGNAIALHGGGKRCLKQVVIDANRIVACGGDPVAVSGVHDLSVTGQSVEGSEYRGLMAIDGAAGDSVRIHVEANRVRQGGYQWQKLPLVKFLGKGAAPAVTFRGNRLLDEDSRTGNDRDLYQDGSGVPLPALRPREVRLAWKGGSISPGDMIDLPPVTMAGARPGDPVLAWAIEDLSGILVSARCAAAGAVVVRLANVGSAAIVVPEGHYGVYVPA